MSSTVRFHVVIFVFVVDDDTVLAVELLLLLNLKGAVILSTLYDPAALEQKADAGFRAGPRSLRPTPNPTPNATARTTMEPIMIHSSFDRRVVGNQEDLASFSAYMLRCGFVGKLAPNFSYLFFLDQFSIVNPAILTNSVAMKNRMYSV